ncbi:hypothetical protein A2U01_0062518 [Trifolium medium]|uniref:LOB domain-containing protein n=1 Tax=Trifolium medium TaxID=97028 RepID=A0A392S090_9FABA|nr:hypothetical protein [Trifolium medium]
MMEAVGIEVRHDLVGALAWEAAQRIRNPITGSHGMYIMMSAQNQALRNHNSLLTQVNSALKNDKNILEVRIQELETEVNDLRQPPAQETPNHQE